MKLESNLDFSHSRGTAKVGAFLYHHGTRLAVVAAARDVL